MKNKNEWFIDWFDTTYYHILYQDRDFSEAEHFISQLIDYLNLPTDAKALDLACGKGRHAMQLNQLGFDVIGVDLSENSIKDASQNENEKLKFIVGDMRIPVKVNYFDAVFNLFTSFGYFNSTNENLKVLRGIEEMLVPNGVFVIDFMNCKKITEDIVQEQIIEKDGIEFHITKEIKDGQIIKHINFEDNGNQFQYNEQVQLLILEDFENLIAETNLKIEGIYGDYSLQKYDPKNSDRLILIGRKS